MVIFPENLDLQYLENEVFEFFCVSKKNFENVCIVRQLK